MAVPRIAVLALAGCVAAAACAVRAAPARADDGDVAADPGAGFVVRHEDSLAGTIDGFDGPYGLFVREANGDVARVTMHRGTIIAPTGIKLAEGMRVTVSGTPGGGAFDANEIDTPYRAAYQPAYGYAPGYAYVPGFGGTGDVGATFEPALYGYGLAPFGLPGYGLAPYGLPGYGLAPYGLPGFGTVPYGPRYGYPGGAFPYGGYPYHVRRYARPVSSGARPPRLAPPVPLAPGVLRQLPPVPAPPAFARPPRFAPPHGMAPVVRPPGMRPMRPAPPAMRLPAMRPPGGAPGGRGPGRRSR